MKACWLDAMTGVRDACADHPEEFATCEGTTLRFFSFPSSTVVVMTVDETVGVASADVWMVAADTVPAWRPQPSWSSPGSGLPPGTNTGVNRRVESFVFEAEVALTGPSAYRGVPIGPDQPGETLDSRTLLTRLRQIAHLSRLDWQAQHLRTALPGTLLITALALKRLHMEGYWGDAAVSMRLRDGARLADGAAGDQVSMSVRSSGEGQRWTTEHLPAPEVSAVDDLEGLLAELLAKFAERFERRAMNPVSFAEGNADSRTGKPRNYVCAAEIRACAAYTVPSGEQSDSR